MSEVLEENSNAERIAVAFSRVLRSAGITTPIGNVLTFVEALGKVGMNDRDNVYWAGRSTLLRRPEDIALYNKAFAVFWERRTSQSIEQNEQLIRINIEIDDEKVFVYKGDYDYFLEQKKKDCLKKLWTMQMVF